MPIHTCEICGVPVVTRYRVIRDSNGKRKLLCDNCARKKDTVAKLLKESFHKTFASGIYMLELLQGERDSRSDKMRVRGS